MSGTENGAERAENRVEQSRAWRRRGIKTMEREVTEQERSGERAKSAAHCPLQPNISLATHFITYTVRTELSAIYSFNPHSFTLHALALSLVQT